MLHLDSRSGSSVGHNTRRMGPALFVQHWNVCPVPGGTSQSVHRPKHPAERLLSAGVDWLAETGNAYCDVIAPITTSKELT